jgi:N-acetylglucosamine malate deacetylase 2
MPGLDQAAEVQRLLAFEEPCAIIVAHPDDETIGAAAQLARFRHLTLVHVTDGAPRDGRDARAAGFDVPHRYAAARRAELVAALAAGGVEPDEILSLGHVDQEAVYGIAVIAEALAGIVASRRIATVLTHAYEGGHPDHDAVACAVARARPARIVEMAGYNAFGYGRFIGGPGVTYRLSAAEQARKRGMLACFASQAAVLAPFPLDAERFRLAPPYDFTAPPHPGRLRYEEFGWALDGPAWRRAAPRC